MLPEERSCIPDRNEGYCKGSGRTEQKNGGGARGIFPFQKENRNKNPGAPQGHPGDPLQHLQREQVAGFRDKETGRFEEVMLLRTPEDLEAFRQKYGITGEIEKIY